jgi:WD40 repeat protein
VDVEEPLSSHLYNSPGGPAWAIDFDPDLAGGRIASGSVAGRLTVWTPEASPDIDVVAEFDAGNDVVRSVVFSDNGALAAGIDDGSVWLWNDPSGAPAPSLLGRHDGTVRSVDFIDSQVVSAGSDGAVASWAPYSLIGKHEARLVR